MKQPSPAIFIGIDPGKTGGLCAITEEGDIALIAKFDNKNPALIIKEAIAVYTGWGNELCIALEKVHAYPGQGVSTSFAFGTGYGIIQGALSALGYEYALYTPQAWQSVLPVAESAKGRVKAYADSRGDTHKFVYEKCRVHHQGCLDAFGIADYHRRVTLGLVERKKPASEGTKKRRTVMKF